MTNILSRYNTILRGSRTLRLLPRGNTVGPIVVTPDSYDTNDSATTVTVGASGATYTDLVVAYNASSVGDVIEIIDDTITLTSDLNLTKGVDGGGKAIKIKGKSTKSTITLNNSAFPHSLYSNGSIEYENISFIDTISSYPFYNIGTSINGFAHFINCTFDFLGAMSLTNIKECVIDEATFINISNANAIRLEFDDTIDANAKLIINNCTHANITADYFVRFIKSASANYNYMSITNSDIKAELYVSNPLDTLNTLRCDGNTLESETLDCIPFGAEATGLTINGYDPYNPLTPYVLGDLCYNLGNLWEATTSSTGSEPTKSNSDWQPSELFTGSIQNNLIKRTSYVASGHGLFVGFGCYDMPIKNNIVTNYNWNIVVKGYNNTIQYNATGKGLHGIAIFVNDQALVANNTERTETGESLIYGPQANDGVGLIATTFRDNIHFNPVSSGNILDDLHSRWNPYTGVANVLTQNIYYGTNSPKITFEGVSYAADNSTEFNTFKVACGDTKAQFLDPQFTGSDETIQDYYKPTNTVYRSLRDSNKQSVGAIDLY